MMKRANRGLLAACLSLAWAGGAWAQPAVVEKKEPASAEIENLKDYVFPEMATYILEDVKVLAHDAKDGLVVQVGRCVGPGRKPYPIPSVVRIPDTFDEKGIGVYLIDRHSARVGDFQSLMYRIASSDGSARVKGDSLKGFTFSEINIVATSSLPSGSGYTYKQIDVMVPRRGVLRAYGSASSAKDLPDRDDNDSGLLAPNRNYILENTKVIKASRTLLVLAPASVSYTEKEKKETSKTDIRTVILPLTAQPGVNSVIHLGYSDMEYAFNYDQVLEKVQKEAGWKGGSLEGFTFHRVEFDTARSKDKIPELLVLTQRFLLGEPPMKTVDPVLVKGRTYTLRNAKVVKASTGALTLAPASATYTEGRSGTPIDARLKTLDLYAKAKFGRPVKMALSESPDDKPTDFDELLKAVNQAAKTERKSLEGLVFPQVTVTTSPFMTSEVAVGLQAFTLSDPEQKDK